MLSAEAILAAVPHALDKLEVPGGLPRGKVRDFYVTPDGKRRVLIATDRLSIFDHGVGLVPYKGQVLNQLSAWWFARTTDIVRNHFLQMPDPNVMVAREAQMIQLAVIVRGYITGVTPTSLWTRYEAGEREIYDSRLPDGLQKNEALPQPIVTATSKSTVGHDDRQALSKITVGKYHLAPEAWEQIQALALKLYERGQAVAARGGLILVDSKYEFGVDVETRDFMLVDELHTPESSRYWKADSYASQMALGREPENLDKEIARLAYKAQGYDGKKPLPPLTETLIVSLSQAFQQVYERLTGETFEAASYPAQGRIERALAAIDAPA
jgi:phosphoribosylaminoimidazole-succinocarboxamide synthase